MNFGEKFPYALPTSSKNLCRLIDWVSPSPKLPARYTHTQKLVVHHPPPPYPLPLRVDSDEMRQNRKVCGS